MDAQTNPVINQLPDDSEWLFPEYDFQDIELEKYRSVIIERILERGSWEQVQWLFNTYDENQVARWVQRHGFRLLSKRSFALWRRYASQPMCSIASRSVSGRGTK